MTQAHSEACKVSAEDAKNGLCNKSRNFKHIVEVVKSLIPRWMEFGIEIAQKNIRVEAKPRIHQDSLTFETALVGLPWPWPRSSSFRITESSHLRVIE